MPSSAGTSSSGSTFCDKPAPCFAPDGRLISRMFGSASQWQTPISTTLFKSFLVSQKAGDNTRSNLGVLQKLPNEILASIVEKLDIEAAVCFSQANSATRDFIASIPMYRRLADHGSDLLLAIMETYRGHYITVEATHACLISPCCFQCGTATDNVFLITSKRLCTKGNHPTNSTNYGCMDNVIPVDVELLQLCTGVGWPVILEAIPTFASSVLISVPGPAERRRLLTTQYRARQLLKQNGFGHTSSEIVGVARPTPTRAAENVHDSPGPRPRDW